MPPPITTTSVRCGSGLMRPSPTVSLANSCILLLCAAGPEIGRRRGPRWQPATNTIIADWRAPQGGGLMGAKTAQFLAIMLTALALVPAGAHFFELPNKIGLAEDDYFVVQNIYRGWALFGIVLFGALA